ncbi:DUF4446 family protein [Patescibacteria group bacterium]|nr:DUF4446 family protein [Patescibacteria group bacterium]
MFNFSKKDEKEPKNFKELLGSLKNLEKDFKKIAEDMESLKKESKFSLQKVGVVRFNPFSGIGGDQSFSVALLNANNNGVVITSLFTREGNRVYAKPVDKGESKYSLSSEEKEAIVRAKKLLSQDLNSNYDPTKPK